MTAGPVGPARRPRPGPPLDGEGLLQRLCAPGVSEMVLREAVAAGRVAELVELARPRRVLGVLARLLATDEYACSVLEPTVRRGLVGVLRANQYRARTFRRLGAHLCAALERAQVPAAIVHGLAVEWIVYDGTGARGIGGIDVLVAPHHMAAARATLRDLGYTPRNRSRFARRLDPADITEGTDEAIVTLVRRDHLDTLTVTELLTGRVPQPVPGLGQPLTVLAPEAAVVLDLARIGAGGAAARQLWHIHLDALRRLAQLPGIPPVTLPALIGPVAAGRDLLRTAWPVTCAPRQT